MGSPRKEIEMRNYKAGDWVRVLTILNTYTDFIQIVSKIETPRDDGSISTRYCLALPGEDWTWEIEDPVFFTDFDPEVTEVTEFFD